MRLRVAALSLVVALVANFAVVATASAAPSVELPVGVHVVVAPHGWAIAGTGAAEIATIYACPTHTELTFIPSLTQGEDGGATEAWGQRGAKCDGKQHRMMWTYVAGSTQTRAFRSGPAEYHIDFILRQGPTCESQYEASWTGSVSLKYAHQLR